MRGKLEATKKLLESESQSPEQIEAILELTKISENEKKYDSLRSWIAVATGISALIVSILVAIFK